jgi:hypothetical protein
MLPISTTLPCWSAAPEQKSKEAGLAETVACFPRAFGWRSSLGSVLFFPSPSRRLMSETKPKVGNPPARPEESPGLRGIPGRRRRPNHPSPVPCFRCPFNAHHRQCASAALGHKTNKRNKTGALANDRDAGPEISEIQDAGRRSCRTVPSYNKR